MNHITVSYVATTTILVLLSIFVEFKYFLLIIDNENDAYYSSQAFLLKYISSTFISKLSLNILFLKFKIPLFFKKWEKILLLYE